jgi:hypothetical protein
LFTGNLPYRHKKHWLWLKGWKKIYQANGPQNQAGETKLTLDKVNFKPKLLKGEIHKEELTIVNLYMPNVGTLNFIKHILVDLKTQIDSNTVVVGIICILLSPIDRSLRQKSTKKL